MSGLDIFACVVLAILIATGIAAFLHHRWLPGHVTKLRGLCRKSVLTAKAKVTLRDDGMIQLIGRDSYQFRSTPARTTK